MRSFTIRSATNQDVDQINALFCREYGEAYPYLMRSVSPRHVNLVAVSAQGNQVVGFARAAPYTPYDHVWELCSLMVDPEWRGFGIARAFTVERIRRLTAMGVKTLVSEAVTCYEDCASQRNLINFGFKFCGLLPFKHPWIRTEVLGAQPLTLALMVTSLNGGTQFGERELFLTEDDCQGLTALVGNDSIRAPWGCHVGLRCPDLYFADSKAVQGLRGCDFVDLPLNWNVARYTREVLGREGYKLAALLPGFGRTASGEPVDLLRLYRPPASVDWTYDLVHVVPELGSFKTFCTQRFVARDPIHSNQEDV